LIRSLTFRCRKIVTRVGRDQPEVVASIEEGVNFGGSGESLADAFKLKIAIVLG
jgi:hypothetical protein